MILKELCLQINDTISTHVLRHLRFKCFSLQLIIGKTVVKLMQVY